MKDSAENGNEDPKEREEHTGEKVDLPLSSDASALSSSVSSSPGSAGPGSLGKRYLFKLLSNVATIPLFFLLEMILPRALGPAGYGNFNFATSLFQNITNFLDMGTSNCLNTALSKRPKEFGLVAFYARVAVLMAVLCLMAGASTYLPGFGPFLMPDVPLWMAVPAALWAYLTWAGRITRGMNDALGITVHSELVRVGVNVLAAGALLGLYLFGVLGIGVFFAHQYVFLLLTIAGFIWTLRGSWPGQSWALSLELIEGYTKEFRHYSGPLFVMALCSMLALSGERWMLQFFDGSMQQGYFSLSQKVGMACFLFVTAMTPLLMRELAVAHGNNDPAAMARLMDRFAPMIYAVAAWFSCFVVVEAPAVVRLFGGSGFGEAIAAVQIMAFYPVHQGYGQVASAVYYATGETRALRNITLLSLLVGLVCTWVLLAPVEAGGFALGAAGLAYKMVAVQVITVNVALLVCRRVVPFDVRRNLVHQVLCPSVLIALACAAHYGTTAVGLGPVDGFGRFFVSGALYTLLSFGVVLLFPFIAGVTRKEVFSQGRRLFRHAKGPWNKRAA